MWIKGKKRLSQGLIVVIIMVLTSGCSLLPKEDEALKPPLVKPVKQNYEIYEVKIGSISKQLKGTASFEPNKTAYHVLKFSGSRVEEVKVSSGDMVKKGDVLVQFEMEGLDLDLKYKLLEYEKAKIALAEAKAQKNSQSIKLRTMELDIAEYQLTRTRNNLTSKQLLSEIDGQVTFVEEMKQGDWIEPFKVIVSVADISQMKLSYQATNTNDLANVDLGMEAEVKYKDVQYKAKVVQTPSSAPLVQDKQLQERYQKTLYLSVDTIPEGATFGSSVDIVITTVKKDNTLIIPNRGLRSYLGRNYVQVLDGERRIEYDVELGIKSAIEVEIISGLKEGQKVILQ